MSNKMTEYTIIGLRLQDLREYYYRFSSARQKKSELIDTHIHAHTDIFITKINYNLGMSKREDMYVNISDRRQLQIIVTSFPIHNCSHYLLRY